MQQKWLRALGLLLGLLLFVVALWALHRILAQYRYQDIIAAAADIAAKPQCAAHATSKNGTPDWYNACR